MVNQSSRCSRPKCGPTYVGGSISIPLQTAPRIFLNPLPSNVHITWWARHFETTDVNGQEPLRIRMLMAAAPRAACIRTFREDVSRSAAPSALQNRGVRAMGISMNKQGSAYVAGGLAIPLVATKSKWESRPTWIGCNPVLR
eukprot:9472700-Pyramimonas_sp.AAC.3